MTTTAALVSSTRTTRRLPCNNCVGMWRNSRHVVVCLDRSFGRGGGVGGRGSTECSSDDDWTLSSDRRDTASRALLSCHSLPLLILVCRFLPFSSAFRLSVLHPCPYPAVFRSALRRPFELFVEWRAFPLSRGLSSTSSLPLPQSYRRVRCDGRTGLYRRPCTVPLPNLQPPPPPPPPTRGSDSSTL